jgi:glycosyltransferase involved in cell wall biosynthesis
MSEPPKNSSSSQNISGWTDTNFVIEKRNSKTPWTAVQAEGGNRRGVLFLTSYPPRVCGIATYCQDLIKALANKFNESFSLRVCALETGDTTYQYPEEVRYRLNSSSVAEYKKMAAIINRDDQINIVLIQHEFGLFNKQEQAFLQFLQEIKKPVILAFHTVLPQPDKQLKAKVQHMVDHCTAIVVMTHHSEQVLIEEYEVPEQKITVIAHGTHLVSHVGKDIFIEKYGLECRKALTTFGLPSSGKRIEITLEALPAITDQCPEVILRVIGKTHPDVVKAEGETETVDKAKR